MDSTSPSPPIVEQKQGQHKIAEASPCSRQMDCEVNMNDHPKNKRSHDVKTSSRLGKSSSTHSSSSTPAPLHSETAFALLKKTVKKPVATGLDFLDRRLKGGGLMPGEILEITGRSGTCKTTMLYHVALHSALPREFNGVHVGGQDRSVLFVDLDNSFNLPRFREILDHLAYSALKKHATEQQLGSLLQDDCASAFIDELFSLTLSRLMLVPCATPKQLFKVLKETHGVEQATIQAAKLNKRTVPLRLLIVDNISAFHWQHVAAGDKKFYDNLGVHLRLAMRNKHLSTVLTSNLLIKKNVRLAQDRLAWEGPGYIRMASTSIKRVLLRCDYPTPPFPVPSHGSHYSSQHQPLSCSLGEEVSVTMLVCRDDAVYSGRFVGRGQCDAGCSSNSTATNLFRFSVSDAGITEIQEKNSETDNA